jgi:lysophospholipase L1-like esterase
MKSLRLVGFLAAAIVAIVLLTNNVWAQATKAADAKTEAVKTQPTAEPAKTPPTSKANSAATPAAEEPPAQRQKRFELINQIVKDAKGSADMVFIGDSTMEGWESQGKDVWHKYYARRNALNLGVSFDRTQHVLYRLENGNFDKLTPKVTVILIGGNNINSNTPEEIAEGVKAVVESVQEKSPKTKVLLLGIFPRGASADNKDRATIASVNALISKLADDKAVYFLDIGDKLMTSDKKITDDVASDAARLQLTAKGYQIWAEAMEPMVVKLLMENVVKKTTKAEK